MATHQSKLVASLLYLSGPVAPSPPAPVSLSAPLCLCDKPGSRAGVGLAVGPARVHCGISPRYKTFERSPIRHIRHEAENVFGKNNKKTDFRFFDQETQSGPIGSTSLFINTTLATHEVLISCRVSSAINGITGNQGSVEILWGLREKKKGCSPAPPAAACCAIHGTGR
jgi:hypothetical protein